MYFSACILYLNKKFFLLKGKKEGAEGTVTQPLPGFRATTPGAEWELPPKVEETEQAKPLGPGAKRHKNTEPSANRMGRSPALQPKFTPRTQARGCPGSCKMMIS